MICVCEDCLVIFEKKSTEMTGNLGAMIYAEQVESLTSNFQNDPKCG